MKYLNIACFVVTSIAFGQWDVVLSDSDICNEPVVYTNQNILITSVSAIAFNSSFTLENCNLQIDGIVNCKDDINLVNSSIKVYGQFSVGKGAVVTEIGVSSIIVTGSSDLVGKLSLKGSIYDKIVVFSDYIQGDSEFIIIDPNSSTSSVVENVSFYGGFTNIWIIDKRLDTPINNCFFFDADYGIWQDAGNSLTDIRFCLFVDNYTAIGVTIEPSIANSANILVDNVIIDNPTVTNSLGCAVIGSSSSTKFGRFQFHNSIIANTFFGWYLDGNTYLSLEFDNIAYYGNDHDGSHGSDNFETNKMQLNQSPFEQFTDPSIWPYFIDPQSPVADVELNYNLLQVCPQQLQTSLFSSPVPRNKGIGIGVPLPAEYSSQIYSYRQDYNTDGIVNYVDFEIFAPFWNSDGNSIADLNDSNSVDTLDLIDFCDNWLDDGTIKLNVTENSDSLIVNYEDPNGLSDCEFIFFLDGEYLAMRNADNPTLIINKGNYSNGLHSLRAIISGEEAQGQTQFYASSCYESDFQSHLSNFIVDKTFDKSKGLQISGTVSDGYEVTLEVNSDDQILWTDSFSQDFNVLVDPNSLDVNTSTFDISYECNQSFALSLLDIIPVEMLDDLITATSSSGQTTTLALEGKPDYSTAGLIICMLEDGWDDGVGVEDTGTARFADKMMRQKGIDTIVLKGFGDCSDVTYETIMKVFKKYKKINYMHIYAHGNYQFDAPYWFTGNIQRTGLKFNDGNWPVYNSRYWTENKYNGNVPDDYEYLKGKNEKGPYLGEFPFSSGQLKILVLESCYGLRNVATWRADGLIEYIDGAYEDELRWKLPYHPNYPYSDICFAFGIFNISQSAIGFGCPVIKSICPYADFAYFYNNLWFELGNGKSIGYAISNTHFSNLNDEVEENFRFRGAGDVTNIYLKTNP